MISRRGFLETLGLVGVALTLPKPLKVMAAKMSDLSAPPLHAGRCKIGPLFQEKDDCHFVLYTIGISPDWGRLPKVAEYKDFENWRVVARDTKGDVVLEIPAAFLIFPNTFKTAVWGFGHPNNGYLWSGSDAWDFWIVPGSTTCLPRYPLPATKVVVHGLLYSRHRQMFTSYYNTFESVHLDRAEAIRLGLASPEEKTFELEV